MSDLNASTSKKQIVKRPLDIAILGATGAVGETLLNVLQEREFSINQLYPLASSRSAGKMVEFGQQMLEVLDVEQFDFADVDIAFFSAGGSVSRQYAERAVQAGAVVIDNTSEYRYENDVPLVVPEVNAHQIAAFEQRGIIANPNCSTIQMVVALKPIHDVAVIKRVNVATYQAVSGTGNSAIDELVNQLSALMNGKSVDEPKVYPEQIAFNVLPQIDVFQENGYTKEEMKMVWETKKILEDDEILVNPTAVRVPVLYGHSEAIHLELEHPFSAESATELLKKAPGVQVFGAQHYPTPHNCAAGTDDVYVGRIRADISHPNGLNLWVVADNLRKGAATNAVQIAEILHRDYL